MKLKKFLTKIYKGNYIELIKDWKSTGNRKYIKTDRKKHDPSTICRSFYQEIHFG